MEDSEKWKAHQRNQKRKEDRIVQILTGEFGKPTSHDVIVELDCGKERPDIVYDCRSHVIIIEVDENQHKHGYCSDENSRMKNIFFHFGGIPVVFVRYNPDNYKVDNVFKKTPNYKREIVLIKWIKHLMKKKIEKHCSVVYLFYDEYQETDIKMVEIDPYK